MLALEICQKTWRGRAQPKLKSRHSRLSEAERTRLEGDYRCVVTVPGSLRSTLNSPLPPLPFSMRAPHASRRANDVPTDRCDLRPSVVSLCPIRPSTSCSLANWPPSPRAEARAPPGSVCSELFLGPVMDASRPWAPSEAAPERGIKQISLFFFSEKGMDECNHL